MDGMIGTNIISKFPRHDGGIPAIQVIDEEEEEEEEDEEEEWKKTRSPLSTIRLIRRVHSNVEYIRYTYIYIAAHT